MTLNPLQIAILKTLAYADVFNYPLTIGEIHQYFIHTKPASLSLVKSHVSALLNKRHPSVQTVKAGVGESSKFYFLQGRSQLVTLRKKRQSITDKKAKVGEGVGKWLIKLPHTQAVYLTGAVAINNATINDDVDVFIITKNNSLWTTRLLISGHLFFTKKRRKPKHYQKRSDIKDKICTNLFLDSTHLKIPPRKQNLFTAHEVVQAKPLFVKNNLHHYFLWQNRWVLHYLPNSSIPSQPTPSNQHPSFHQSIINHIAYHLQYAYMKPKLTLETVTLHSAYFHPRNTSKLVLDKYHQRLQLFGINP